MTSQPSDSGHEAGARNNGARIRVRPVTRRAEAQIIGVGSYRPARVVTNEELAQYCDTSDGWIRDRTGIVSRRFAEPGETVADMAVAASENALAHAGIDASEVDLVLVATSTHPYQVPGAAPEVASRIGAHGVGAADLSVGCAGFCYSLSVAADAIRAGSVRCAVVVGSEKLTDLLDIRDRTTAVLFGDGAGAVVLTRSEDPRIGPVAWGSDGRQNHLLTQSTSWVDLRERDVAFPVLRMDGRAVFRWAATALVPVARRACELAGVDPADIQAFVPHQANLRIIDALVRATGLPEDVPVARDIVTTGNTSAASVPLALSSLVDAGEAHSGDAALLLAFGSGLSVAGQVVSLP
jgi:3-oxoacyl-[acyl-carrier-protein] synthase III